MTGGLTPFDEERDWYLLTHTSQAPHELPAVLRLQRRGLRGQKLIEATRLKPTALQKALQDALDREGEAFARGCEIHDQPSR